MAPWSLLSNSHTLYNLFPLSISWIKWLAFNKQNTAKVMGYHFWDQVIKDCDFILLTPHSFMLGLSDGNQVHHVSCPMEKPTGQGMRVASSQQLVVNRDLLCRNLWETESYPQQEWVWKLVLPQWRPDCSTALLHPVKAPISGNPAKPSLRSWPIGTVQ